MAGRAKKHKTFATSADIKREWKAVEKRAHKMAVAYARKTIPRPLGETVSGKGEGGK